MKLVFERSTPGHRCDILPACDVPEYAPSEKRVFTLRLPELSEIEVSRHYTELSKQVYGVNSGFYPLGSCTMKYNPAVNEDCAALPGFTAAHPLAPSAAVQGCLEVIYKASRLLCAVTGMDAMTLSPAAGAHGEVTGLMLIKAYHASRGEGHRNEIIVPDSAHGTNPASAAMLGYNVINIPSLENGCVDIEKLREAVGENTAGLMLTNPNTLGLFDKNILEITQIVHEAGGLNYYDGANMNAIMGAARPSDMGFDVVHLNLHKTFATPHGGGGPGSGAVGVKSILAPFLPGKTVVYEKGAYAFSTLEHSIGGVKGFYGNFLVVVKALAYILNLGGDGLTQASQNAVLNANYLKFKLSDFCDMANSGLCMHEFVAGLERLKNETGVSALDVAKSLIDYDIHPPTMYFPLIVHEALMFEPTETESKQTLDYAADVLKEIIEKAYSDPEYLHNAPHSAPISRPDEVMAARNPIIRYEFPNA